MHDFENYVYHIQKAIEEDLQKEDGHSFKFLSELKPVKKENTHVMLKQAKSNTRKIESKMKKLEEEKKTLLEWFESNPTQYSEEKNIRIGEITKQLEKAEHEWLGAQLEIERLS
jgi:hypothetical protein